MNKPHQQKKSQTSRFAVPVLLAAGVLATVNGYAASASFRLDPPGCGPGESVQAYLVLEGAALVAGGNLTVALPPDVVAGSARAIGLAPGLQVASRFRTGQLDLAFASSTSLGVDSGVVLEVPLRVGSSVAAADYSLEFAEIRLCDGHALELPGTGLATLLTVHPPPVDLDGDGMPDDWERAHFGGTGRGGAGDSDRDGVRDAEEYLAGTDPGAADSFPAIQGVRVSPGDQQVTLEWQAGAGREYGVEWTDGPLGPDAVWRPVYRPDFSAEQSVLQWTDDGSRTYELPREARQRFYRIRAELP